MTKQPLIDQVETFLPFIRQQAKQAEQQGYLTSDVLECLFDLRLFRLFIAKDYNGLGTDLPTALKVFEKVASADGATGWLVMIGAGGGLFSGFIEPKAATQIFTPENAVIAGSGMPFGMATSDNTQYHISGRWPYASGAKHASWFTANCQLDGDKEHIVSIAVPRDKVTIHDTWSVMGMKATGSHDFTIDPTTIDQNFGFNLFSEPLVDEPIFHCPLMPLAHLTFASVALGIAKNALKLYQQYSQQKGTFSQPELQQAYQSAKTQIESSDTTFYAVAEQAWQDLITEKFLNEDLMQQIAETSINAVHDCLAAVDNLKTQVGMLVVFTDSEFGRAWRDIHVLSQHAMLKPLPTLTESE